VCVYSAVKMNSLNAIGNEMSYNFVMRCIELKFSLFLALSVLHVVRLVCRLVVYWQVGGLQDAGIAWYSPAL
jgi:hypothetical protein